MLNITYTPPGGEPTEYDIDPAELTGLETIALEEASKKTIGELLEQAGRGGFTGMLWLFWVARRRAEPTLLFTDVVSTVKLGELAVTEPDEESGKAQASDVESQAKPKRLKSA